MNIEDMKLGDIKKIAAMFDAQQSTSLNGMIGKKVIVRTYSAGCWFGELTEKSGGEVILSSARRMWRWLWLWLTINPCAKTPGRV